VALIVAEGNLLEIQGFVQNLCPPRDSTLTSALLSYLPDRFIEGSEGRKEGYEPLVAALDGGELGHEAGKELAAPPAGMPEAC
jgi:hypothetical protein